MTRLRGGYYVTIEQYRRKIGYTSCQPVYRAIKENRLKGAVKIGERWIVPSNAVIVNKTIKHGAYIGLTARLREAKKIYDNTIDND